MDTLGAIPVIPVFEGDRVSVSRNAFTLGTRPLQLLPLSGSNFSILRFDTIPTRCAVSNLSHWFIFGFGEMTLTPADYTAITGLGFDGEVAPLDARYQTAALGAELVRTLLGVPTRTRYTTQGYISYKVVYKFWAKRIRTRLTAWRELPADGKPAAPAYTREQRDQAARSFIFYIISSQLLCTSQNKGDPAVLACLRDLSLISSYDWASLALAHLYHGLDVWTRGGAVGILSQVWAYEYRIYPGGSEGDTSTEARRIPRYLAHRHHTFSRSEDPHYWRCYLNDRALADVDLGKACAGGSSTDASAFWDLLDPPMQSRVIAAGFGDYATGLPDYTAITGLGFDGEVAPLDARYQTAALGAELVRTLLGVPTRTRYTTQGYISYKVVYKFWAKRIRTRLTAWRELPADGKPAAPAYTREQRDQAARSFIFYIISTQLLCTSQNKGDPAVLSCLRDLSLISSYDWASLALAHLYHGLDVWTRGGGECNWQFLRRLRCGHMSTGYTQEVRRVILPLRLGEFLDIWRIATILFPGPRIHTIGALSISVGGRCLGGLSSSCLSRGSSRSRVLLHDYWVDIYFLGERVLEIHVAKTQRRVPAAPPRHMCILEGQIAEGPGERRRHRTPAYYRAQAEAEAPAGPAGAVLGDVTFPLGMEVALDPTPGLRPAIAIPADLRQAPPQLQLDPEHAAHISGAVTAVLFRPTYIARLYPELHERLEIGRLRRYQSRQNGTISHLQMEVDRLRTRLKVEGIPLDFFEEEDDDDDGSSSDDAPTPPPSAVGQAATGPSWRRR
ncbi:hypothetical protein JCGZ_10874 [Jatropha curcas]|uniref:Aminotransferase-like plant mobile domain-containing protein n=1 Tax=Jatropha curcas TaxID=180498 RepID=A0A067KL29_JATCU|nr:hypothetical protein JCGZ_10874 [Jatropha curcas]